MRSGLPLPLVLQVYAQDGPIGIIKPLPFILGYLVPAFLQSCRGNVNPKRYSRRDRVVAVNNNIWLGKVHAPGAGRALPADTSQAGWLARSKRGPQARNPKLPARQTPNAENKAYRIDPTRLVMPKPLGCVARPHTATAPAAPPPQWTYDQPTAKQERPQPLWLIKAASEAAGRLLCLQRRSEPRTPSPSRRHVHRDCRPVHAADDGSAD